MTRLTAGYSLASLAGPIFTILLTPLYMHALTPADYAIWDTNWTLGILVLTLGTLGLNSAAGVFFYDGDDAHGRTVVSTAAFVAVGWSLLVALVFAAAARPLASYAFGTEHLAIVLYLSALNLPLAVGFSLIQAALRLRMAVKRSNILAVAYVLLLAGANCLFVLVLRWGVLGIQVATLCVTVVLVLWGARLTWRDCWARPSTALAWPLVRAGLPFLPNTLAFWALAYVDRLLLPLYGISLGDRGLYAVANRLASALSLLTTPFQNAWGPLSLAIRDDAEAPRTYARVLTYFAVIGLGLALALGLFAGEILAILAFLIGKADYVAAAPYVPVLSYYVVANGATVAVGVGVYLAKRTDVLGWTTLVGAATNLALNLALIPRFGVWGAAWATALGYGLVPLTLYLAAQRIHPIPYEPWRLLATLAIQGGLLFAGVQIRSGSAWLDATLKLGLLLVYIGLLVLVRVLRPGEAHFLLGVLRRPRAALQALVREE